MPRLDEEIDHLYRIPLTEFTRERNELAKRAGSRSAGIRTLPKPTLAAWAINQLFWQKRSVYDELIVRAEDLRATHDATIRGRRTDLRGASRAHEESIEAALKATLTLLADAGQPATEATRQAIATTLRSLPGNEPPGRLSRQLQPRGFEMFAGSAAATHGRVRAPSPDPPRAGRNREGTREARDQVDKAAVVRITAAREELTAASRATREADQLVRREEFEAARAGREADKAERRLKEAEDAFRQADAELTEAKRASASAIKGRDAARAKALKASEQLDEARGREERARGDLEKLT